MSAARRAFKPLALSALGGDSAAGVTVQKRKPWWLYPNLLSLDAPLVSLAWLHIFAESWRLGYHPWQAYICLGLVVWSTYVFDRLLDVSMMSATPEKLEARHRFHHRHRKVLITLMSVAMIVAAYILVTAMPFSTFSYLLMGCVMVAAFFGLSMLASENRDEVGLSKNLMAGLAFAYGTAMSACVYRAELGVFDLILSREFICFGVLCMVNIAAIDFWEHSERSDDQEVKASDELAVMLPLVALAIAAVFFALQRSHMRPFYYAILSAVALLYLLNRRRSEFSQDALRVLADVTLLVPVLVFHATSKSDF